MLKDNFFPLVSIVIPVYNGENYLKQAIDSALAQTYKNIEIIVVNDGSKDNTEEIAKGYGNKIRYFYKENGGCATALNLGVREMKGEYFSWLSHDDLYENNKIEHQINVLKQLDNPNTIIYGGYKLINHNSQVYGKVNPRDVLTKEQLNIPLMPLLRGLIHGCALLIPTRLFSEIGTFDEKLLCTQDYALWFEFLSKYPICFDNELLTLGREHPNKSTHTIPSLLEETNETWSRFLKQLTVAQMVEMEGSEYLFLRNTVRFFSCTPYQGAYKLAEELAFKALSKIKVTVIIPFYNRISWTIEAIQSVQAQTHRNFEILLINDGSTKDITGLQEVIKKDTTIKYYSFENNKGPAAARNLGVENASGEYIAFLDSDDLFLPDKLEKQLKYMEEEQLVFAHTSYERVNFKKQKINYVDTSWVQGVIFPAIIQSCPIATPTVMIKTSYMKLEKFPEHFKVAEDICLWISLASKYLCGAIKEPLTQVRISDTNTGLDDKKQIKGLLNIAFYVTENEYYNKFNIRIRDLISTLYTLTEKEAQKGEPHVIYPQPKAKGLSAEVLKNSLLSIFLMTLKREGLRITFNKSINYLIKKLIK